MRKASIARLVIVTMIGLATALFSFAIDTKDAALLTQPAIGAKAIAFVYANDLWTAGLDGANPRRLTTDVGVESNPAFSPDGSLIAFSGQY
jgi:tricorn protease